MPNYITNIIFVNASEEKMQEILNAIRRDDDVLGSFDFNKLIPMPESLDVLDGSITDDAMLAFLCDAYRQTQSETSKISTDKFMAYIKAAKGIRFFNYKAAFSTADVKATAEKYDMSPEAFIALGKQYLDNQRQHGAHTWYSWCSKNWGTKWNAPDGSVLRKGEHTLCFDTAWNTPLPVIQELSKRFPSVKLDLVWADEDLGYNVGRCSFLSGEVVDKHIPEGGSKEAFELAFEVKGTSPEECCLRYDDATKTYVYDEEMERSVMSLDLQIQTAKDKQAAQEPVATDTKGKEADLVL